MTAFSTKALCTGTAVSGAMLMLALLMGCLGEPTGALVCLLSAGAVLYGVCLAMGWKAAVTIFKGK